MVIRVYHESSVGQPTVTALQCNSSKTPSTTKANTQIKVMSCQCPYSKGVISLKHRNYKLRMWVELMTVPVLWSEFFWCIGIAIFAQMRVGVVVFRVGHTPAFRNGVCRSYRLFEDKGELLAKMTELILVCFSLCEYEMTIQWIYGIMTKLKKHSPQNEQGSAKRMLDF